MEITDSGILYEYNVGAGLFPVRRWWAGHWHSSGRGANGMKGILYKIEMIETSLSGGSHGNGMTHVLKRKQGGNGQERNSVVQGTSVLLRLDYVGRGVITKNKHQHGSDKIDDERRN